MHFKQQVSILHGVNTGNQFCLMNQNGIIVDSLKSMINNWLLIDLYWDGSQNITYSKTINSDLGRFECALLILLCHHNFAGDAKMASLCRDQIHAMNRNL